MAKSNPQKLEYMRRYRAENRDAILAYQHEYREAHGDVMREQTRQRQRNYRAANRKLVEEYLLEHPCTDCGESDIGVLDFDHVRGTKVDNICELVRKCSSTSKIVAEIAKCEVRCANCHRRVTAKRRHVAQPG